MSPALFHLAILRGAAILVPESRRTDWLAEWRSELWHVRRDPRGRNVAAFCMGAFQDAFWLRRERTVASPGILQLNAEPTPAGVESFPDGGVPALCSPLQCLTFLMALGVFSFAVALVLPASRAVLLGTLYPRNLVMLTPASERDASDANGFSDPWATISKAQFDSLKARKSRDFEGLAFYVPEKHSSYRVRINPEWFRMVQDEAVLAALPPAAEGFVIARLRYGTMHESGFHFVRARDRSWQLLLPGLPLALFVFFMVTAITYGSRVGRPVKIGPRRGIFLAAKMFCILPVVILGSLDLTSLTGSVSPAYFDFLLFGAYAAARWNLADQRARCPVCLRLLANPVRIGGSSRILLEWHGTELMCQRGHGLLYVPAWPAIWSGQDQWLKLDSSWTDFFPDRAAGNGNI